MNRCSNDDGKLLINIVAACLIGVILLLSQLIHNSISYIVCCGVIAIFISNMIIMAVNTYKIADNNDINFLCIAFIFIILFYSINSLTCKYIGVFSSNRRNIAFYFLTLGIYLEAISMYIVINFKNHRISGKSVFAVYFSAFIVLFLYGLIKRNSFNYIIHGNVYNIESKCMMFIGVVMFAITYIKLISSNVDLDNFSFNFAAFYFIFTILSVTVLLIMCLLNINLMQIALVCKAIAVYCLYKSFMHRVLKYPYGNLFSKLRISHDMLEQENAKRKEIQIKLNEKKEEYEKLINSMPYGVLAYYLDKYVFANKAAISLLHAKSRSQILDKNVLDFVHPDDIEKMRTRMKLEEKEVLMPPMELRVTCIDGETIDAEISWSRFLYKNKNTSLIILKDITEKIRLEKLEKEIAANEELLIRTLEYDKLKTDFFANLSHELRTPINIIFTSLQLMDVYIKKEDFKNRASLEKSVMRMRQNSYRLLRLVNNLIDITKIDSGYFKINPKNFDIVCLIRNIVISIEDYVKSKQLTIEFTTGIEKLIIMFDPDSVERIILNLLSNAIKFTPKDGRISIEIHKIDRNELHIARIIVQDTGIGIPQDKLDNIFDRFVQVDKSFVRKTEGSGIGLSLVKALVELQGGSISVKSKLGEGSEFVIELPVRLMENSAEEECAAETDEKVEKINIEFSDIYN